MFLLIVLTVDEVHTTILRWMG